MSAIEFDQLTFAYPGAAPVLQEFSLTVESGETVVIVGDAGSGKSTLLRAIPGLVPHSTGGIISGRVVTDGRATKDHLPNEFAGTVGFIHQDPGAGFVAEGVDAELRFGLVHLGLTEAAIRRRIDEVTDALALGALRGRPLSECSGGERQRAALASVLAMNPSILLADEPTGALDPGAADDFVDTLLRLNQDYGTTVLIAEHRLERLLPTAPRCAHLHNGALVADQTLADYVATSTYPPGIVQLGLRRNWDSVPLTVRDARRLAAADVGLHEPTDTDPHARPSPGPLLYSARGLRVRLRPKAPPAVADASLDIHAGEVIGLLGRNGAGKTTLLRALSGLVPLERGTRTAAESKTPNLGIGYVPQDPTTLFTETTLRGELERTREVRKLHPDREVVDIWLERCGLSDLADRPAHQLSGGQQVRAAIATIAVGGDPILALDEPTRGLDAAGIAALHAIAHEFIRRGGALMIASHDLDLIASLANRLMVMSAGEIVEDGTPHKVLSTALLRPAINRVIPWAIRIADVPANASRRVSER